MAEEAEAFVCGACGASFESAAALDRHVHEAGLVD
jgi:hypothetical protein